MPSRVRQSPSTRADLLVLWAYESRCCELDWGSQDLSLLRVLVRA